MKASTQYRLALAILPATAIIFACGQKAQAIATQLPNNGLLESWEPPVDGNDPANGWYIPSWGSYGSNENATSEATGAGGPATDGSSSLEVDDPNTSGGFAWEVGYQTFGGSEQNNGAAFLAQFDQAVTNNAGNYNLTFDVIYKSADIPASPSSVQYPYINGSMLFQWDNNALETNRPGGNNYASVQVDNIALADPTSDSVQHVSIPLTTFAETSGGTTYNLGDDSNVYWVQMYLAINGSYIAGSPLTVFYDNMRLTPKILGDTNGDGIVDTTDLATVQSDMGQTVKWGYANGDFNGDGVVNADDFTFFQLGAADYATGQTASVPEPGALAAGALAGLMVLARRRAHR